MLVTLDDLMRAVHISVRPYAQAGVPATRSYASVSMHEMFTPCHWQGLIGSGHLIGPILDMDHDRYRQVK